jgi:hypothetical protein
MLLMMCFREPMGDLDIRATRSSEFFMPVPVRDYSGSCLLAFSAIPEA